MVIERKPKGHVKNHLLKLRLAEARFDKNSSEVEKSN